MSTYEYECVKERGFLTVKKRVIWRAAAMLLACVLITPACSASISFPERTTAIGESAFQGCAGLNEVVIPNGVTTIGALAFADCEGLVSIEVPKTVTALGANSLGREGDGHTIIAYAGSAAAKYAADYGIAFEEKHTPVSELLAYAHSLLGTPYKKYDCVMFVYTCYKNVTGIRIPDTCLLIQNNTNGVRIDRVEDLMPGDIICWMDDNSNKDYCTHVGMYVGAGTTHLGETYTSGVFIESSYGYGKVRYNHIPLKASNYYYRNFLCAWRILPEYQ